MSGNLLRNIYSSPSDSWAFSYSLFQLVSQTLPQSYLEVDFSVMIEMCIFAANTVANVAVELLKYGQCI